MFELWFIIVSWFSSSTNCLNFDSSCFLVFSNMSLDGSFTCKSALERFLARCPKLQSNLRFLAILQKVLKSIPTFLSCSISGFEFKLVPPFSSGRCDKRRGSGELVGRATSPPELYDTPVRMLPSSRPEYRRKGGVSASIVFRIKNRVWWWGRNRWGGYTCGGILHEKQENLEAPWARFFGILPGAGFGTFSTGVCLELTFLL